MTEKTVIEQLIQAAFEHGTEEGLDVEAGDLQEMLRAAWALLTPDQQVAFFQRPEITTLMETPEYEDIDTTMAGGARTFAVEWNDEQLAAAGIEKQRLEALVRSLWGAFANCRRWACACIR